MNQCVEPSPQFISSEWSLQSGLPSQSTETETHSSLSAHANCPDPQRCTGTLGPLEGDVGTLGVTGRSTHDMTGVVKSQSSSSIKLSATDTFFTSCAAKNLHSQVEVVPELYRNDAKVLGSDQPTQPAGHRSPAKHPHLKNL